jgi:HAE1 family hydrophobic/amphiphilic exporter-1
VVPLLVASGAGAEARKVMGMTVFSGMLMATVIGVLIIPALYVLVSGRGGGRPGTEGPLDEKVQQNVGVEQQ